MWEYLIIILNIYKKIYFSFKTLEINAALSVGYS